MSQYSVWFEIKVVTKKLKITKIPLILKCNPNPQIQFELSHSATLTPFLLSSTLSPLLSCEGILRSDPPLVAPPRIPNDDGASPILHRFTFVTLVASRGLCRCHRLHTRKFASPPSRSYVSGLYSFSLNGLELTWVRASRTTNWWLTLIATGERRQLRSSIVL
ncbi:hypothetical protein AHAS_Ahas19G0130600 [Arachis hypogaea]